MNGFFLVNKEKGMTSFDVVFKVKKKLNIKKIGHTGTLDPNTEGLLVLAVGRATKLIQYLEEDNFKEYIAEATLGYETDSQDSTGNILSEEKVKQISEAELNEMIVSFLGESKQIPPQFSAKKVNGKRAYEYARNNEKIELKQQDIEVFEIELLSRTSNEIYAFRSVVTKGTYIRTMITDMAIKLETIGVMSALIRTKTDGFDLKNSKKIANLTEMDIITLDSFLLKKYPKYEVYGKISTLIKNGSKLQIKEDIEYPCLYIDSETQKPIAIYDIVEKETKPLFMCWEGN